MIFEGVEHLEEAMAAVAPQSMVQISANVREFIENQVVNITTVLDPPQARPPGRPVGSNTVCPASARQLESSTHRNLSQFERERPNEIRTPQGQRPVRRCTGCREPGHYRTSCTNPARPGPQQSSRRTTRNNTERNSGPAPRRSARNRSGA